MNKFLTIVVSLAFVALWVYFFQHPVIAFESVVFYTGIMSLILWVAMLIRAIVSSEARWAMIMMWIINWLFGWAILAYPLLFSEIFLILLWIWLIILWVVAFSLSFELKTEKVSTWRVSLVVWILTILVWIFVMNNMLVFGISLWYMVAIMFIVYGIGTFASLFNSSK